jgi:hypothetical protein
MRRRLQQEPSEESSLEVGLVPDPLQPDSLFV